MSWQPKVSISVHYPAHWLHKQPVSLQINNQTIVTIYPGESKRLSYKKSAAELSICTSKHRSQPIALAAVGEDLELTIVRRLSGAIEVRTKG